MQFFFMFLVIFILFFLNVICSVLECNNFMAANSQHEGICEKWLLLLNFLISYPANTSKFTLNIFLPCDYKQE